MSLHQKFVPTNVYAAGLLAISSSEESSHIELVESIESGASKHCDMSSIFKPTDPSFDSVYVSSLEDPRPFLAYERFVNVMETALGVQFKDIVVNGTANVEMQQLLSNLQENGQIGAIRQVL